MSLTRADSGTSSVGANPSSATFVAAASDAAANASSSTSSAPPPPPPVGTDRYLLNGRAVDAPSPPSSWYPGWLRPTGGKCPLGALERSLSDQPFVSVALPPAPGGAPPCARVSARAHSGAGIAAPLRAATALRRVDADRRRRFVLRRRAAAAAQRGEELRVLLPLSHEHHRPRGDTLVLSELPREGLPARPPLLAFALAVLP
eukprot:17590-Pelagococcus_subviridis.AAC.13